jgi:hypothetical protein
MEMIQPLSIVIANEGKQSHEIATSPRWGGTPRNDRIVCSVLGLFRIDSFGMLRAKFGFRIFEFTPDSCYPRLLGKNV